jgi:hypothetical protein
MAQAVECLPCKCEALRANPSPTQKKKKKRKKKRVQTPRLSDTQGLCEGTRSTGHLKAQRGTFKGTGPAVTSILNFWIPELNGHRHLCIVRWQPGAPARPHTLCPESLQLTLVAKSAFGEKLVSMWGRPWQGHLHPSLQQLHGCHDNSLPP